MQAITELTLAPAEFDYTDAGSTSGTGHALYANGVLLCNQLEALQVEDAQFQAVVCSHCGTPQCVGGNWLAARRLGAKMVLVPCIELMATDQWQLEEYAPPETIRSNGPLTFDSNTYDILRHYISDLPELEQLPPLTNREACHIVQLCAPGDVLGHFPHTPTLSRELVLAVDSGDLLDELEHLELLLVQSHRSPSPFEIVGGIPVNFFLDLPRTPPWAPMTVLAGQRSLLL